MLSIPNRKLKPKPCLPRPSLPISSSPKSAKVLIGGLLESGTIIDPQELQFLMNRLKEIEARLNPR
jgi:hypothetical protein